MKGLIQFFALLMLTTQAWATPPTEKGLASYYDDSFHGRKTASGVKYDKNKFSAAHKTLPFGTKVKVTNPANGKSVIVEVNDRGPYIKGRIIELSRKAADQIGMIKKGVAPVEVLVVGKSTPVSTTKATPVASTNTKATPTPKPVSASTTKASVKTTTTAKKAKMTKNKKPAPKKVDTDLIGEAQDMETGGLYKMQVLKLQPKGFGVQVAGYSDYQAVIQQLAVLQKNWFKGATVFVDQLDNKPYYKIILGPMATKEEAASYAENIKKKYSMKDAFVVDLTKLAASAKAK